MEDAKSRAIKSYFTPFPNWAVLALVVVVAGIVWQGIWFAYGLGWAVLAAAGWAVRKWSQRPADQQIDTWLAESLSQVEPRSLERSHLDKADTIAKPVMFCTVRLNIPRGTFFGVARGQDREIRFTPLHVTVVQFTEHRLVVYQCALDLTTGHQLNESVNEIAYQHVVSVATNSSAITLPASEVSADIRARCERFRDAVVDGQVQLNHAESFLLTTSGGTSLRIVLRDPVLIAALGGGTLPTDRATQAVRAILTVWRQRSTI